MTERLPELLGAKTIQAELAEAGPLPRREVLHARGTRTSTLVAGEIAAGRNPADALEAMLERSPVTTFAQWSEAVRA